MVHHLSAVQGKWMKTTHLNTIKDPLNGEKFITISEVDESEIKVCILIVKAGLL